MKLNVTPRANVDAETGRWYRDVAQQVNAVSEGRLSGSYTASASVPITGTWAVGDKVRNSAPAEAGTAGNKYVIEGWICTAAGTPGTWLQQRTLTGN
jgi:hypothetical protein